MIKPLIGVLAVAHDLIDRFFDINTPALQLDLNQREAVDKERHIIAVGVLSNHGGLMGYLIAVNQLFLISVMRYYTGALVAIR